jgi:hypothetical protein
MYLFICIIFVKILADREFIFLPLATIKILTHNQSDELLNLFEFRTNTHLRGHRLKLKIQKFKTCQQPFPSKLGF